MKLCDARTDFRTLVMALSTTPAGDIKQNGCFLEAKGNEGSYCRADCTQEGELETQTF